LGCEANKYKVSECDKCKSNNKCVNEPKEIKGIFFVPLE